MPWWIKTYLICYLALLIVNVVFWIKAKGRLFILIYEMFAGLYLALFTVAFWEPAVINLLNLGCIPAILIIFTIDIYLSISADRKDFGIDGADFSDLEFELSKIMSIIFAAPLYIVSALTTINLVKKTIA